MDRLKYIKDALIAQVESQMTHVTDVDAKELGEAVDMIKDLAETAYYCAITEAMEEGKKEPKREVAYYYEPRYPGEPYYYRDMDRGDGRMYYNGGSSGGGNNSSGGSSSSGNSGGNNGGSRNYGGNMVYSYEYPVEMRDRREGRSPTTRKSYMEAKEMHHEPAKKMQELEKYMHELSGDITEMIEGASVEEKQLLKSKIAALASKIS